MIIDMYCLAVGAVVIRRCSKRSPPTCFVLLPLEAWSVFMLSFPGNKTFIVSGSRGVRSQGVSQQSSIKGMQLYTRGWGGHIEVSVVEEFSVV